MTTDAITARNRANARKSTGPRTARGKAIVAGNARRHGATARPDPESIATWLAIILDRPAITPADVMPGDEAGYRALALAEAEVRQVMAERALLEFEAGREAPEEPVTDSPARAARILEALMAHGATASAVKAAFSQRTRIARAEAGERPRCTRRHRLLRRYLREARSRRRRAFAAWAGAREAGSRGLRSGIDPPFSRNEARTGPEARIPAAATGAAAHATPTG